MLMQNGPLTYRKSEDTKKFQPTAQANRGRYFSPMHCAPFFNTHGLYEDKYTMLTKVNSNKEGQNILETSQQLIFNITRMHAVCSAVQIVKGYLSHMTCFV